MLVLASPAAHANPAGGRVAAGSATISPSGGTLNINQTSQRAVINWQSFNIGSGETTDFIQPDASAIALNRVVGVDPSKILGNLNANGQVWLVNPDGIAFGRSARVDVAGLLATTIDIADSDFMNGNYNFSALKDPGAMVSNAGLITIRGAGLAALVAPGVDNSGVIEANYGQIQLSSTAAFTLDLYGDGLFNIALDKQVTRAIQNADGSAPSAAVSNSGGLIANGGKILLTANVAKSVVDHAINMTGYAQATSASESNGVITLDGGSEGTVEVSGTADASGGSAGQTGGTVQVTGQNVELDQTARLNASGDAGGGTVLVGGGEHGQGALPKAETTNVAAGAQVSADAGSSGNGGTVVVWSNAKTNFAGSVSARGGASNGDGGSAEVSSHGVLAFNGSVDLRAPHGAMGSLLLDPENVTIAATGSIPTLPSSPNGPITLQAQGDNSVLSVATLESALALADVMVTTGATGTQAGDITLATNITWSGGTSLTLSAYHDIVVDDGVVISNEGTGNLNLHADNTGTGSGTVTFLGTSKVDWSASTGLVSIFYNPPSNPAGGTLSMFSDSFNRADGAVGNGWSETSGNTTDLAIQGGALTVTSPNGVGGIYRPIDTSGTVTVSANISQENGNGGLLDRYTDELLFGNDGTVSGGYGVFFYRGDQTYSDSQVQLMLGNQSLATIASPFQFGADIHATVTLAPNGDVRGTVTEDGNSFSFDFGPRTIHLPGSDFAIVENGADSQSAVITEPTISGFTIAAMGSAYTSPTDFSSHIVTISSQQFVAYMLVNGASDLQDMQNNLAGTYALGRDIDAGATSGWNGGAGFIPVGDGDAPFSGVLEGSEHTIDSLTIKSGAQYVGLFGALGSGGVINGVTLTNATVAGTSTQNGSYVGGLVGDSHGSIDNSSVSGAVSSTAPQAYVGGIVGWMEPGAGVSDSASSANVSDLVGENSTVGGLAAYGYSAGFHDVSASGPVSVGTGGVAGGLVGVINSTLEAAHASGDVSGGSGSILGGLVGEAYDVNCQCQATAITNSYATGTVTGGADAGGLVGAMTFVRVYQSYATGTVSSPSGANSIGGLVGFMEYSNVSQSFANGPVIAGTFSARAGGLVGWSDQSAIYDSYATGSVTGTGTTFVGGLVGGNAPPSFPSAGSSVLTSYATGLVSGPAGQVGGLIGDNVGAFNEYGAAANSYWDVVTSGTAIGVANGPPTGASGLTTLQLKSGLPSGFDSTIWTFSGNLNSGYPILAWQTSAPPPPPPPPSPIVILFGTKPLTWTVANANSTYGMIATLGAVTLNGVAASDIGSVSGVVELFRGATEVSLTPNLPVGNYTEEVVSLIGPDAGKYTLADAGDTVGTLTIDPKILTWNVANATATFGTIAVPGEATVGGVVGGSGSTCSSVAAAVCAIVTVYEGNEPVVLGALTPVGTYTVVVTGLSGEAASNYVLSPSGDTIGTLTIGYSNGQRAGLGQVQSVLPAPQTPPANPPEAEVFEDLANEFNVSETTPAQNSDVWSIPTLSPRESLALVEAAMAVGGPPAGAATETVIGVYSDAADAFNLLNDLLNGQPVANDIQLVSWDILNTVTLAKAAPGVSEVASMGEQALTRQAESLLSSFFE